MASVLLTSSKTILVFVYRMLYEHAIIQDRRHVSLHHEATSWPPSVEIALPDRIAVPERPVLGGSLRPRTEHGEKAEATVEPRPCWAPLRVPLWDYGQPNGALALAEILSASVPDIETFRRSFPLYRVFPANRCKK
jgi:hypothetical protein